MRDVDRFWLDTMEDTISIVRAMFADHALFLMLCGAVFALQQDMLKAHGIDMRKVRTSREQARSTLNKLYDIDDVNLDLLQEPVQILTNISRAHSISARMRSIAARIWLLTNYASRGRELRHEAKFGNYSKSWRRQFVDDAGDGR